MAIIIVVVIFIFIIIIRHAASLTPSEPRTKVSVWTNLSLSRSAAPSTWTSHQLSTLLPCVLAILNVHAQLDQQRSPRLCQAVLDHARHCLFPRGNGRGQGVGVRGHGRGRVGLPRLQPGFAVRELVQSVQHEVADEEGEFVNVRGCEVRGGDGSEDCS